MEIAADAGWDGCTLPARPKCKASTVSDVQKKNRNRKKSSHVKLGDGTDHEGEWSKGKDALD